MKTLDDDGTPLITVDARYGFRWAGDQQVHLGDRLARPDFWHGKWRGFVTALGSDYDGKHQTLTKRRS